MSASNPNQSSSGFTFNTPAGIQDFSDQSQQDAMNALWNANLNGFTQQGMVGNPWNATNAPAPTNYYNPEENNPSINYGNVQWHAFPGRLAYNYPQASQDQLNQMADTGQMIGNINNSPCDPSSGGMAPYYPYGPRGWQDEYCEWAVTRNKDGKITRIDFTCENPEYWNSLWLIDPSKVLELYQTILNKPQITLEDLSVPNITNPITGQPVYNPLNKWNSGTVSDATKGGAIHLTSTPNTLQTEIGLATAASVQRNNPSGTTGNVIWSPTQYNALLCDAQFGQKFRNSDPNIGGTVNSLVNSGHQTGGQGLVVTLANPPGLYIQQPDFSNYKTPDGTPASTFWNIVRGSSSLTVNGVTLPGQFILHAVFEVPSSYNYTVGDILIGSENIQYGSQVAGTFQMQIVAMGYAGTVPQGYDAVGTPSAEDTYAQPLQLFYQDYFNALYNTPVPNPVNYPIPLLSNSTFIPPTIFQSANNVQMVLICSTCTAVPGNPSTYPTVSFDDPNITATVDSVQTNINYAVPGNSLPSINTALYITVNVGSNAAPGRHGVFITNPGQPLSAAMPSLLNIEPITIQSTLAWQKTGVTVGQNSNVMINYVGGLWTANPEDNNGVLYNAAGNPERITAKAGYTMPGEDEGALIGRINGILFLVGMGTTVPAHLAGEIELCINDDLNGLYGPGLTDNIGSIQVSIK